MVQAVSIHQFEVQRGLQVNFNLLQEFYFMVTILYDK